MSRLRLALDALRPPAERHSFGAGRSERADLHLPRGDGPFPVAIVLHGGYWQTKYGKIVTRPLSAELVRRGFAAWNVEYRRIGRGQGGGWPATFADVAAGIDLLTRLDAPLDLDDVTAIGHSAGGQLALWSAARGDIEPGLPGAGPAVLPRRVIGLAPVTNLVRMYRAGGRGGLVEQLLGGSPEEHPDRYRAFDPLLCAPLAVPVRIVHPTADETVSVKRSREYALAAREAGGDVELAETSGTHRSPLDPGTAAWARAAEWL